MPAPGWSSLLSAFGIVPGVGLFTATGHSLTLLPVFIYPVRASGYGTRSSASARSRTRQRRDHLCFGTVPAPKKESIWGEAVLSLQGLHPCAPSLLIRPRSWDFSYELVFCSTL